MSMSVVGRTVRSPASASAWRTQLRRASGCTFSCSPSLRNVGRGSDSRYSRTARSRSSSGYFRGAGNRAFLPGSQDRTSLQRLRRTGGTSGRANSGRVFGLASVQPAAMTWTDLRAAPDSSTSGPWGDARQGKRYIGSPRLRGPDAVAARSAGPVEHIERDEDHDSDLAALLLARYSRLAGWQVQLFDAIAPYGDIGLVKLHSTAGGAENLPLT